MKIGFNNLEEFGSYNALMILIALGKKAEGDNFEVSLGDDKPAYIKFSNLVTASNLIKTGTAKKKKYKLDKEMTPRQFNNFKSIIAKLRKALNEYRVSEQFSFKISIDELKTVLILGGLPENHEIVFE